MPHFQTSDNLSIYYEDEGTGLPVLCLAGLTRNSADFSFVTPHLTEYRVIAMDYRGRGLSDNADDFMSYNILREAQDALELLDHLGIERCAVLGTSRGGLIAMVLSLGHAARLSGVILNDIGPAVAPAGLERIMDYVGKTPPYPDLDAMAEALAQGMAREFPGVPLSRWRAQAEFMFAEEVGGGLRLRYDARLRDAMIGQAGAGEAPDLWQLFDGLRDIPLAVLRGANSDLLSVETLSEMKARHPDMIAAEIPDRGHVPFLDEPEALETIHALLRRLS